MSRRIERVNELIKRSFGEILLKEADLPVDVMVTISRVETAGNLASADVLLYVYPISRAEETLKQIQSQMYDLQGFLNRALDLKPMPRIRCKIDYGAEYTESIEKKFRELDEESRK